ncbi:acyltransferase [Bradyrhizobium jicamae]|uniref:acyltransferase family protein n=1 Tax=Bradyrhizobium jicamae TaxID=280332 RepID=UPI001BA9B5DA|nr:acyltransferase [Bradyrhizobium jicamae]MBR0753885.1 acyltransferase [Bradyrhizobium jicamae]
MSERVASLDFLRGTAALAVAVPHFLMAHEIAPAAAETISILGVEIFFVLSGYVLAPQILFVTTERPSLRNLGIFWVRRWMRTVPPYLIALVLTSITAHRLLSMDFVRYALYLQNLFHQANASDYFPIAWSLSVEEWFYITFPLTVLLVGALAGRKVLLAAALFIAAITLARTTLGDDAHWGAEVRRIVAFRVDAIAWGFLLYLAVNRTRLMMFMTPVRSALLLAVTAAMAIGLTGYLAGHPSRAIEFAFPFYASGLGAAAIIASLAVSRHFETNPILTTSGLTLGRISYSVYLFHPLVLSALSRFSGLPWPFALAVFLAASCAVAGLMAAAVEAPILSARPGYWQPLTHLKAV